MRPALIIFDCDGVLIESETIASRVVARNLSELGWPMSTAEAMSNFLGMSIVEMVPVIEARLGRPLPAGWREEIAAALVRALAREATPIPHARETLAQMNRWGVAWRVASNSSDEEMAVKFARTGLTDLTEGKAYSGTSLGRIGVRPKPAPDVFLHAAYAAAVMPGACLVLEDSPLGVSGAVAAGMRCIGFAPHGDGSALLAAGAARLVRALPEFVTEIEVALHDV